MDGVPRILGFGVPETSHVDHVAEVEGNEHGEDARGGMDRILERKPKSMMANSDKDWGF